MYTFGKFAASLDRRSIAVIRSVALNRSSESLPCYGVKRLNQIFLVSERSDQKCAKSCK